MNPYLNFVQQIETQFSTAKTLPLGGVGSSAESKASPKRAPVMLFSPHPDDECITGLLPLRLMREMGMPIINVPVTFGSNLDRRPDRFKELKNACNFLGWELLQRRESSWLESSNPFQSLEKKEVIDLLETIRPSAIVLPHSSDWNSRHISTHLLVMDALAEVEPSFSCSVIETEFWGAMENPNLMVEANAELLADLVKGLSFHIKEVKRNPYHLSLPAWMQDNVRRGGELIGGQGGDIPDFIFATLYRLRRWENGGLIQSLESSRMLAIDDNLDDLF